jgi:hypothetical protein
MIEELTSIKCEASQMTLLWKFPYEGQHFREGIPTHTGSFASQTYPNFCFAFLRPDGRLLNRPPLESTRSMLLMTGE